MTPNEEQAAAISTMLQHAKTTGDDPFFKLEGPAGTGKTFTTKFMMREYKRRTLFTAPTNKAVRVLREALKDDNYRPEARTIYSALGLQMLPNGEVKELRKREEEVDLSDYHLIVVDEAFMVNKVLMQHIRVAAENYPRIRWIFMGDSYQLPPVGEADSPVSELTKGAKLITVMRQDNQILTLATRLRGMVERPFGQLRLEDDNDGEEGVWTMAGGRLDQAILNQAESFRSGESKAIAWRNAEVDRLNALIRQELFAESLTYPWQPGDRITLLGPVKDLEGEPIGTTDEEGTVEKCDRADHPVHGLACYRIVMRSDMNSSMALWVLHPSMKNKFEYRKARLAETARAAPKAWGEFWEFVEAFHPVRHAYAITAHRAQGSTYHRAFVSWRDILLNRNRAEAMRCLYVGATRPKKELYLG